jgi:rare lipoprotein A
MLHGHRRITAFFWTLLIIILFVSLNGCSTGHKKDGPPPFDIDETKVADAVPRSEPLSKYGNMHSYRVFGKNYYVMPSAKNYEERGIASWYGSKFHKQRTSSGERYDMLAMTAAHKTLPLPTYVQVTNLKNGRQIIVKVNDRGPFASNRIIDLSYVAAKKLGMIGHGTTYVDVKSIDPLEAYRHPELLAHRHQAAQKIMASAATHHHTGSPVYFQVGAFKNRLYAEKLKSRLLPLVSSPIQITQLAKKSHHLYHVNIGPIKDLATADHIKKKLRSIGITPHHSKV